MSYSKSLQEVVDKDLIEELDYFVDCKDYEGENYDYNEYRRAILLLDSYDGVKVSRPSRALKDAIALVESYASRFLSAIEDGSADPYIDEAREAM